MYSQREIMLFNRLRRLGNQVNPKGDKVPYSVKTGNNKIITLNTRIAVYYSLMLLDQRSGVVTIKV